MALLELSWQAALEGPLAQLPGLWVCWLALLSPLQLWRRPVAELLLPRQLTHPLTRAQPPGTQYRLR